MLTGFSHALRVSALGSNGTSSDPVQLELERMRFQEMAASRSDLQQQLVELQQRVHAQAGAVEAAQLRAARAEARQQEATQQVGFKGGGHPQIFTVACGAGVGWQCIASIAVFHCSMLATRVCMCCAGGGAEAGGATPQISSKRGHGECGAHTGEEWKQQPQQQW